MAAQILTGHGYEHVFNLSGGIKAWDAETASGDQEVGLELFVDIATLDDVFLVAYSLEAGLRDFYLEMHSTVNHRETEKIFELLAAVELKHQDKLFAMYCSYKGEPVDREDFVQRVAVGVGEGGLATDEYIRFFGGNGKDPADAIALAMSIEAQAMDLYHRAGARSEEAAMKKFFAAIVREEKSHLAMLSDLMNTI